MIGARGRRQFAALALVLATAPWFRGGRDAGGLVVIALFLALGLIATRTLEPKRLRLTGLGWWYGALMVWASASWFWSANRYATLVWVATWLLGGLAALLAVHVASDETSRARLLRGLLELAVIFSVYGIWLFVTGDYNRLTSTFYWANPWATFLFPAVILALGRYVQQGRKLYLGMAAVLLTAFLLTYSRAALLVLVVVVLVGVVARYHRRWHLMRLALSLALVAVSCIVLIQLRTRYVHQSGLGISARFADALSGDSVSGLDRLYYLRSAWAILVDNPVAGTGAGTYGAVHPAYQFRVISAGSTAHNVYAQTAAELGGIGAIILIGFGVSLLLGLRRQLRHDPERVLLTAGLLALLLHAGLDIGANYPAVIILGGLLIGTLYRSKPGAIAPQFSLNWLAFGALALMAQPLVASYRSAVVTTTAADEQSEGNLPAAAEDYRSAHLFLTYSPDTLTAEGINRFAMASAGRDTALNTELAIRRAEAGIHQDPRNAENYLLLARSEWLGGSVKRAEQAYLKGLQLDPWNQPLLYSDLATLYLSRDRNAEALELSTQGLAKYPGSVIINRNSLNQLPGQIADLYVVQGHAWEALGNLAEAVRSAQTALETDRSSLAAGNMYKRLTGALPPR